MTIEVELLEGKQVLVADVTADMGGSFYYDPLRPYSPLPLKWCYEQLIRYPEAVLIDVGANTGCYSLLAKHHPDLTVHAFEPVQYTWDVLRQNVELNDLGDRVNCHLAGISNYNGKGTIHTIKQLGGLGVSMVNGTPAIHKDTHPTMIDVWTIDALCTLYNIAPTFIKIDTEGGEKFVLEGARETIQKHHPFILTEYSVENAYQYGYAINEIVPMLEEWGYVWTNPEGSDLWCVPIGWEHLTNTKDMK